MSSNAWHVALRTKHGIEVSGGGLFDCIESERFIEFATWVGGIWLLCDGQAFLRDLLRELPREGLSMRGSRTRVYSAYYHASGLEFRDADSILPEPPPTATKARDAINALCNLLSADTPPRSCGYLLAREVNDYARERYPARGSILRSAAGSRQQVFRSECKGGINLYDLRSSYGAAACAWSIPRGRESVLLNSRLRVKRERAVFVDCLVSDKSAYGLLPRKGQGLGMGRYGSGTYRAAIAEPLLLAAEQTKAVKIEKIVARYVYHSYSIAGVVRDAWSKRLDAERRDKPLEAAIWRYAIQQFCGKFSEQPSLSEYLFALPPRQKGVRVISWDADVYARDKAYYPALYHPSASAWIRQVAQIPLVRHLVFLGVLRVYVDSIALVDRELMESTELGGWRRIASGDVWHAESATDAYIASADGEILWEIGRKHSKPLDIALKRKISTQSDNPVIQPNSRID